MNFPDGAASTGPSSPHPSADRAAYHGGGVGSPAETRLISALLSGSYGNDPAKVPALATLLAGPLLRGSEVGIRWPTGAKRGWSARKSRRLRRRGAERAADERSREEGMVELAQSALARRPRRRKRSGRPMSARAKRG